MQDRLNSLLLTEARECRWKEIPARIAVSRARVYPNQRCCLLYLKYDHEGELVYAEITTPYSTEGTYVLKASGAKGFTFPFLTLYRAMVRHQIFPESIPKKGSGMLPTLEVTGMLVGLRPNSDVETFKAMAPLAQHGQVMFVPLTASRPMPMVTQWLPVMQHRVLGMLALEASRSDLAKWVGDMGRVSCGFVVAHSEQTHQPSLYCFRVNNTQPEEICVVNQIQYTLMRNTALMPVLMVSTKKSRKLTAVPLPNFAELKHNHITEGSVVSLRRGDRGGLIFNETVAEEGYTTLPLCSGCLGGTVQIGADIYCTRPTCRGLRVIHLHHALNVCLKVEYLGDSKIEALIMADQSFLKLLQTPIKDLAHLAGFGDRTLKGIQRALDRAVTLTPDVLADLSGCFAIAGMSQLDPAILETIFKAYSLPVLKEMPSTGKMMLELIKLRGLRAERAATFIAGWPAFQTWLDDFTSALKARAALPRPGK